MNERGREKIEILKSLNKLEWCLIEQIASFGCHLCSCFASVRCGVNALQIRWFVVRVCVWCDLILLGGQNGWCYAWSLYLPSHCARYALRVFEQTKSVWFLRAIMRNLLQIRVDGLAETHTQILSLHESDAIRCSMTNIISAEFQPTRHDLRQLITICNYTAKKTSGKFTTNIFLFNHIR